MTCARGSRPAPARTSLAATAALLIASASACGDCRDARPTTTPAPSASASSGGSERPEARRALSFIDALPGCDVDHRGPAIDLGTPMIRGRLGWSPTIPASLTTVEHDGATWTRIAQREVDLDVTLLEPTPVFVGLRVAPRGAKSVAISIDGAPLATLKLPAEGIKVLSSPPTTLPLDAGQHRITLRFSPASREDPYADVDWIRVGRPDEIAATFGAPTLPDLVDDATSIARQPRRSLLLRPPASVRCALRVPPAATVRASVGVIGEGRAEAEIRVLADGAEPVSLVRREVHGGADAAWMEIAASLDAFVGQLVTVELAAPAGATTGRLAFGEPEVVVPKPPAAATPDARGVLVVVLTGLEAADLPPWSGREDGGLEGFTALGARGVTFLRHRAPSTLDVANLATLLTGLPPESHGLVDAGSRLPAPTATLLESARESQVRTSFISSVPTSFAPFGLSQGAAETVELSPVSGDDAATPLRAATTMLVRALAEPDPKRAIVIAHVRGGHPPWTPTPKQLEALAPRDYAGNLQPRRAAQQIAEMRGKRVSAWTEQDLLRIRAHHALALAQHDEALTEVLATLETAQVLDQTMIVVTTDGASSVEQMFSPDLPLSERSLGLPLWILFPRGALAGRRVGAPSEVVDVARTLHLALGLSPAASVRGDDLFAIAAGGMAAERVQLATMGNRFAARWGDLTLQGTLGKAPGLCDLRLDPTCAFDRRPTFPLAASAMFRSTVEELARRGAAIPHEALVLDETTRSALAVWGR